MSVPSDAERVLFKVVSRTADGLRGSQRPQWYLWPRIDQMLDDYWILGPQRDDVAARAFFILGGFAAMNAAETPPQHGALLSL